MMETKYKDKNGIKICYGDILKWTGYEQNKYVNEPFLVIVKDKKDGKDYMYFSLSDEYEEITAEDYINYQIPFVEKFIDRKNYEHILNF